MARVKLHELTSYPFQVALDVRVTEINYGAHLGFDRLLGMAHQARIHLFDELGASELDLGDGRTGVVALDLAVVYQGMAFLGDRLSFEIGVVDLRRASFRLAHRVRRPSDDAQIALIELGLAAFDAQDQAVSELPGGFHAGLTRLAGRS